MRRFPKRSIILAAAGLVFATAGVATAERGDGPRDPAAFAQKMEKRVVEKLGPSLGLDEAKSKELAAILAESGKQRHAAMKKVKDERGKLQQLVDNKASAKELDAQRAQLEAALNDVPSRTEVLAATGRILNSEQQAKLALKLSGKKGFHGKKGHHGKKGEGKRGGKRGPASQQ